MPLSRQERLAAIKDLKKPNPNFRTICEVLREIYVLVKGDQDVEARVEEAMHMAKRMNAKLKEHKSDYDKGWWERK